MSKSYKPKDGNYIDSTGVVHNQEPISNLLNVATSSQDGLMSSTDKSKLDNILIKNKNSPTLDLNSVNDGIQIINGWSSSTISNLPSSSAWGILIQNSNSDGSNKLQIFIGQNTSGNSKFWVRLYSGGSWGSWKVSS